MSAIAECPRCKVLVFYRNNSDLLDGHRCPDGSSPAFESWKRDAAAKRAERTASHRSGVRGGPVGSEVYSEYDSERESLDASEPPKDAEEELAEVDTRLLFCRLCGSRQFRPRWDETDPIVCSACGAILKAGSAA